MNTKHTPGPWRHAKESYGYRVEDSKGHHVADADGGVTGEGARDGD